MVGVLQSDVGTADERLPSHLRNARAPTASRGESQSYDGRLPAEWQRHRHADGPRIIYMAPLFHRGVC